MSLFKKGKLGKSSGDDGADEGVNPDIEAEAEAHATADAEIAAAEAQAEAGGMPPASPDAGAAGMDTVSMPPAASEDLDPTAGSSLDFDDGMGDSGFDDFDDDYVPQPAASKKKFLVAAIALVVLGGGSFGLMSMMGGSDGPPPPQPPSQQQASNQPSTSPPPAADMPDAGGLPMPDAAQNIPGGDFGDDDGDDEDMDFDMADGGDLPPLSAPGMPPAPGLDTGPAPLPMAMPPGGAADDGMDDDMDGGMDFGGDTGGMDIADGGLDMPPPPPFGGPDMGAPDMDMPPPMPLDAPDMDAPDLGAPDLGAPDLGMPDMPMPMNAETDAPDMDAPDLAMPDMPPMDLPMPDTAGSDGGAAMPALPGEDDTGLLDDLDSAMSNDLQPAPPMPAPDTSKNAMGDEMTLAEQLGADLAPLEVRDGETSMPSDDGLSALVAAPPDDLNSEFELLDALDDAGPAAQGIAGAANDLADTGRTRGRLNMNDLDSEPQLTPVFPRNKSKYLNVQKDYGSSTMRAQVETAQRALKEGRDSLALELFDALYVKNPKDPRIMMGRAVALQKNGMVDEAVDAYEKVLKRDPRNVNALTNMLGLIRLTDPDRALTKLLDLKSAYPGRPSLLAQLGMTYADIGDEESAMRYLTMAQDLEPDDPRHAFNMAVLMDRRGNTSEAISNYKRALFLNATAGGNLIPSSAIQQRLEALR